MDVLFPLVLPSVVFWHFILFLPNTLCSLLLLPAALSCYFRPKSVFSMLLLCSFLSICYICVSGFSQIKFNTSQSQLHPITAFVRQMYMSLQLISKSFHPAKKNKKCKHGNGENFMDATHALSFKSLILILYLRELWPMGRAKILFDVTAASAVHLTGCNGH